MTIDATTVSHVVVFTCEEIDGKVQIEMNRLETLAYHETGELFVEMFAKCVHGCHFVVTNGVVDRVFKATKEFKQALSENVTDEGGLIATLNSTSQLCDRDETAALLHKEMMRLHADWRDSDVVLKPGSFRPVNGLVAQ